MPHLPSVEEVDAFSIHMRECFSKLRRVCPFFFLLDVKGADSFLRHGRACLLYSEEGASSLHREESAPLLYVEEADSLSIQRRERFLYT